MAQPAQRGLAHDLGRAAEGQVRQADAVHVDALDARTVGAQEPVVAGRDPPVRAGEQRARQDDLVLCARLLGEAVRESAQDVRFGVVHEAGRRHVGPPAQVAGAVGRQTRERLAQGVGRTGAQELVGVESEIGVGGMLGQRQTQRTAHVARVVERHVLEPMQRQRQSFVAQRGEDARRGVVRLVVDDHQPVEVVQAMADEGLDDVGLVLDDGDADQLHRAACRPVRRLRGCRPRPCRCRCTSSPCRTSARAAAGRARGSPCARRRSRPAGGRARSRRRAG